MKAIVAVCQDWGIGYQGKLLVKNREDMHHFVQCTKPGTVIMGRKTLLTFPGGRPLKGRRNIVLAHGDGADLQSGIEIVHSVKEALQAVQGDDPEHVWVIGGASVYQELLPYCSEAVVTKDECVRPADTYFLNLDEDPAWNLIQCEPGGMTPEDIAFSFATYRNLQFKTL